MDSAPWLQQDLFRIGDYALSLGNLLAAVGVLVVGWLFVFLLRRLILAPYFRRRDFDEGRRFAITQLLSYFIYIGVLVTAIQVSGLQLTVLWAAGAALLVGIGIGLQQTFNDFMSGIILLSEGSIKKGDWLQIGDMEGKVIRIGMRTSMIQTRRRIAVIMPNSKITMDPVINMSHAQRFIRYEVHVGVAYGSNVRLVERVLIGCAADHESVLERPAPFVRFEQFGNSSLDFSLHFFSEDFQKIMDVKSDIRFEIDRRFRENGVQIPFPQRDLHIKTDLTRTAPRS